MGSIFKSIVSFVSSAIVRRPIATALGVIGACEVVSSAASRFFRWMPLEIADVISLMVGNATAVVYYTHSDRTIRQLILTAGTAAWSLRLSLFLLIRTFRGFRDNRLDNLRGSVKGAVKWCIVQTIWIFVTGLPVWIAMRPGNASSSALNIGDLVGVVGFVVGWLFEAIGDEQKASFIKQRKFNTNSEKYCCSGLFKLCRFPNYFGDWLMWTSLSIVSYQTTTHWSKAFLPVVPYFLYQLFHKVSIKIACDKMKRRLSEEDFERWNQIPLFFPTKFLSSSSSTPTATSSSPSSSTAR